METMHSSGKLGYVYGFETKSDRSEHEIILKGHFMGIFCTSINLRGGEASETKASGRGTLNNQGVFAGTMYHNVGYRIIETFWYIWMNKFRG